MKIPKDVKDQVKKQRLTMLQNRYYNFHLDYISLKNMGDEKRADECKTEMDKIEVAYKIVEAENTE
ncbi:MAG: hypothetical protein WC616_02395 [Candidatus Omnitrophota bacterium]